MKAFLAVVLVLLCAVPLVAQDQEAERLQKAATVVEEVMGTPEKGIPTDLLKKAVCVGVIPSQKKVALGIGGTFGRGALVCRRGGNGAWGGPSMFTVGGANIGFQLGGQATDFVLIVMNPEGAKKLLQSKTKLGADASVAGGPVGRTAQGATDLQMRAEILTYSRSRGLFAGVSLDGQVVKQDNDANERLYGRKLDPKDILFTGSVAAPAAARPLVGALQKFAPRGGQPFKEK
ncbi:MAG: lipid-binding SYLF domain-containing protein [Terriglobia bacterium]